MGAAASLALFGANSTRARLSIRERFVYSRGTSFNLGGHTMNFDQINTVIEVGFIVIILVGVAATILMSI